MAINKFKQDAQIKKLLFKHNPKMDPLITTVVINHWMVSKKKPLMKHADAVKYAKKIMEE